MMKRIYTTLTVILSLLIFCNFQCDKEPYCTPKQSTKAANTLILPASQKYYNIDDTIVLQVTLPYSNFSDLNTSVVPIKRYEASYNFQVYQLTGGAPYNCKFAGDKFDAIASRGTYFLSGPTYSLQAFYAKFESDSVSTNSFVSEIKLVPKQPGRYVIFDPGGNMQTFHPACNEVYSIQLLKLWNVVSRNTEVIAEAGITSDLSAKYQNLESGFQIGRNDLRLFCFEVQ